MNNLRPLVCTSTALRLPMSPVKVLVDSARSSGSQREWSARKPSMWSARTPSICSRIPCPDKKPCFNVRNVVLDIGNDIHAKMIRSFLYSQHWPREPSVTGLWMNIDSPYLAVMTEKYSYSGDRLLAFEREPRTGERKLIGVAIGSKTFPWVADEYEDWAHHTFSKPDRNHMYFTAHCLRSPDLFNKYKVGYIYQIEVLTVAAEVAQLGVAQLLLGTMLKNALELRHPLVQFVSTSAYSSKVCERCGLTREWSMNYSDYVNEHGMRVFFPRRPHLTCALYIKKLTCGDGFQTPCLPT